MTSNPTDGHSSPSNLLSPLPIIGESRRWLDRAQGLIPALTQTLAKGPSQHVRGVSPVYLARGKGSHVWDVDGNEFIDLTMAVGPLSLGYCHEPVDRAIRTQLEAGITFSLMHPLEVEVAELIRQHVPNAESVRFSKTGADVTSAAVRVARAYTGRDKVVACGYHGWHDWYAGLLPRNAGVPDAIRSLVSTVPYGDVERTVAAIDDGVACVILEPILFDEPKAGFLEELRAACTRRGALLVFDEMWTGFRLALGGAQQHFSVTADLACFSKAVANGMPLSVLTGRREIMRLLADDVFFFTTFGGEALSLAAAKATLEEMSTQEVIPHLFRQGRRLRDGYDQIARDLGLAFTRAKGLPPRAMVEFDPSGPDPLIAKSLVEQELLRRGVLWSGFHNVSFSHTDADVDHVLAAYRGALTVLAEAVHDGRLRERLRGEPIQPTLRRTR